MKAFVLDRYGSADRVRAGEMPVPQLREDDVLVQIHAAGVNRLDSKIRNGEFKRILPYRLPLILGHDGAGVVVRVGSRVRRFKAGDEVHARPADGRIGAFAAFIAIDEDDVAIKPKALSMEEAASIPLVGLTAWQALIERAELKHGDRVLIHAGSGGVGTLAIQLRSTSARRWRRRLARPTWIWSEALGPTSLSITRRKTSHTSCATMTCEWRCADPPVVGRNAVAQTGNGVAKDRGQRQPSSGATYLRMLSSTWAL